MKGRTLHVLLALAAMTLARPAPTQEAPRRTVLNRVVAVVEDDCITSVELDRRWAPSEKAFAAWQTPDARQRDAARSKARRELLDAMIDARLVAKTAAEQRVTASPANIDTALASIAAGQKLSVTALLAEAQRLGFDEPTYRVLIAEQILEGRLVTIELGNRGLFTDGATQEQLTARFGELARELKDRLRRGAYVYSNLPELER